MTYLDGFLNLLNSLPELLIYFLLGLSAFVENVFPPIPGDTITAFGAFMVGIGRLHFAGVFLATTLGSLAGFMCLFWIGSVLGRRFFIKRDIWFFKADDIIRAEQWFRRYGYFLILLNRFFPGIRSVISISGGISGLSSSRVAVLAIISAAVWNTIWIAVGYTLGTKWEVVRERMSYIMMRYNIVVFVSAAVLVIIFVLWRAFKKNKSAE